MTILLIITVTFVAGLAALVLLARIHADEAESTGLLKDWGPGAWLREPISRDQEPAAFENGIRWLRAIPWIAAAVFSFGVLLIGLLI